MRIMVNALSTRGGGGYTYLMELVNAMSKLDRNKDFYLLTAKYNEDLFAKDLVKEIKLIKTNVTNLVTRLLYEQFVLPFLVKVKNIDLLYCPAEILSFFAPVTKTLGVQNPNLYYETSIKRSFKEIAHLTILKYLAKVSLKQADEVIAVSNELKEQVCREMDVPMDKIHAIHHGIRTEQFRNMDRNHQQECLQKFNIQSDRYILCVSNIHPHKNIETLLRAYKYLEEQLRKKYKLVFVGRKKTRYFKEISQNQLKASDIENQVIFTSIIPFDQVIDLYKNSALFVFPSRLETFGLPLLEAMASGVPIIAANTTAIPEVLGDAGLLFDPNNSDELSDKITILLQSDRLREELIEKGYQRVQRFSWEETSKKTLKLFEEAAYSR